ncbi:MAG: DUF6273 domain-containing protein [Roseburia sp.]|nr:DUF6273 domain-containing protein [Roseburia sp.]MCM1278905.1 DUF6273 domain-containing protein [Robinsoniella sp.]
MKKQTAGIPKRVRILSLFLAVSMFFGLQGFEVLAETVSENAVKEQESITKGMDEEENGEEEREDNGSSVSGAEVPELRMGDEEGEQGDAAILTNPEHHCTKKDDGTDYTDYSYVWFGSYPQSEVTDSAVIASIDSAIAAGNGSGDTGNDVWVDGIKYRRISKTDTTYDGYFEEMPVSGGYRYFKWERIKWRVLQKNADTLFVVVDKAIDCKKYNDEYKSTTWETSTLRNWLNNGFYSTAFSSKEQSAIMTQNIVNEDNSVNGTEGGNDTSDKVYLLSVSEAVDKTYGFCDDSGVYSMSRRMGASDYANARGTERSSDSGYEGNCCWWLRSPGGDSNAAADVGNKGGVYRNGTLVYNYNYGVCPALHINLTSDLCLMEDDGTSGSGGEEAQPPEEVEPSEPSEGGINNPVYDKDNDTTKWSYVWFGSYPQSEVTDSAVIASIDSAIAAGNGSGDTGRDVWVDGIKYRRISKTDTNSEENFGSNDYRYFKWERMKWRVLQNDGETLFLMADKGLDCRAYNECDSEIDDTAITWETATLREWLNNSFYHTAFNGQEAGDIVQKTVYAEDNSNGAGNSVISGGNNTQDSIYLLSYSEVTNTEYGFKGEAPYSASRRLQPSDYAYVMGALSEAEYEGNCRWWLRSPGWREGYAAEVLYNGSASDVGMDADTSGWGCVVPVLHINLSSEYYCMEDDGTSGSGGGEVNQPIERADGDPLYNADSDTTEWSYIYFGSYPQTEVTGTELTTAITGAAYDSNGDAWVDGTRYRRLAQKDMEHTENFGDSAYRYFKWERLKWRILKNEGSTLFVMAEQAIDGGTYHSSKVAVTWEKSQSRSWLNDTFYKTAFTTGEQAAISQHTVKNESNPYSNMSGGNDTQDKIYLLSLQEATNPEYGFCEKYDIQSQTRRLQVSDYAFVRGISRLEGYGNNCMWWLRTPGTSQEETLMVLSRGGISLEDNSVHYYNIGYAPVMHIDTSALAYREEPAAPVHHCTKDSDTSGETDETEWSYVYFGSYPQSEVTGSAITSAIRGAAYDSNGDAWVNGTKYRRISVADTNYAGYFGNNTYRYFKWERIRWRVLENDGKTLFLMADNGLDCKSYHQQNVSVTWKDSDLRSWLNQTFYQAAFNQEERMAIAEQTVSNENNPYYGTAGGSATKDKVYLLSYGEAVNPSYGFCADGDTCSVGRRVSVSDYAHTMGASVAGDLSGGDETTYKEKCLWWLRTPGGPGEEGEVQNTMVYCSGEAGLTGSKVTYINLACVPVLHIKTDSALWMTKDDGTSGSGGGTVETPPVVDPPVTNPPTPTPTPNPTPNPPSSGDTKPISLSKPVLKVKRKSYDSVKLSWNQVSGAAGYHVYRSTKKNGSYKKIKTLSSTSFINKGLKQGKTYYYKVVAYRNGSASSTSAIVSKKIRKRPKTPKIKITKNSGKKTYTLWWGTLKDAKKVEVWRAAKKKGKYKKVNTISAVKYSGAIYSYAGKKGKFQYYYKVRSYYVEDGAKIYSKYSNIKGFGFK